MKIAAFKPIILILLHFGCATVRSDEIATRPNAGFSTSSSDPVLRVTWSDARTLRKWSRTFLGDGTVEAADVGFDGKAIEPALSWLLDSERLAKALALAVEGGLTTSSQQEMQERIRKTGRPADYAEDEVSLIVELRFTLRATGSEEPTQVSSVFQTRDPIGMAKRFPEVPQLAALASLYHLAREFPPK